MNGHYYIRELTYVDGEKYSDFYMVSDTHLLRSYGTSPCITRGWGECFTLGYSEKTFVNYYSPTRITEEEFYNSIALIELAK